MNLQVGIDDPEKEFIFCMADLRLSVLILRLEM